MKYSVSVFGSVAPAPLVAGYTTMYLHSQPVQNEAGDFVYEELELTHAEYASFLESGKLPEDLDPTFLEQYNDYVLYCKGQEVRAHREALLLETDWTQLLDAPIDEVSREEVRVYRQALRDVPEQEGFPYEVVWPEKPSVIKGVADPVDTAVNVLVGGV